ncbi:hypothetical protein ACFL2Z_01135 [Candidatus Eisenbacteria bacterium]|uniref:Uncharacterized protein n=1 Tax=Eiseniibacteriota bacterium TaxID=2212470 RepID=A0ABV6YN53_UNCEI
MPVVMRTCGTLAVILLLTICAITPRAMAQDTHYWTYTYGTRASLLNGAIIGSVVDISAAYYNPGALPLIEEIEVLLAARAVHYPNIWLRNIGGSDLDLKSSRLAPAPSIVAGMFKLNWAGDHRFGYSLLTRQSARLEIKGSWVGTRDSVPDFPDAESATADAVIDEDLSETWVGISWGYGLSSDIGIGITQYATFRYHKATFQSRLQNLKDDGSLALTSSLKYYDYANWRMLWKLGATFHYANISMGLTITTPSIKFYDEGASGVNVTATGVDFDGDDVDDTVMGVDYANDIESDYRTPASLGFGATYLFGATTVHFSTEWFNRVKKYTVMNAGDFPAQSGGDTLSNRVTHELDQVINFGIGLEHSFRETFQIYGGFATDYSARKEGTDTNLSITDWDIYSISGGAAFSYKRFQVTFGLGYSWGGSPRSRKSVVDPGSGEGTGFVEGAEFEYKNIKALLGFAF